MWTGAGAGRTEMVDGPVGGTARIVAVQGRTGPGVTAWALLSLVLVLATLIWTGAAYTDSPADRGKLRVVPGSRVEIQQSFAPVVERVAPAVVNIYAKRMVRQRSNALFDDPFFRRFFGDTFRQSRPREEQSLGSGVILGEDGLVVTNHHVVADAEDITVVLNDRREFEAELVLTDEETDLAVLRIDPAGHRLPYLQFRDSDDIRVGDLVLAIGNPFGVGQTVTSGIVSGLARSRVTDSGGPQSFIQTDAAINPGNSGGALVSMDGRLVGINTAIFTRSGGSHGVGFAIPSNLVASVIRGARSGRGIVRAWAGVTGQELTADLASGVGRERPGGVLVAEVYPGGAADRAGIRRGDVMVSIDGHAVQDPAEMQFRIATRPVGERADIEIWRGGRDLHVRMELEQAPEDPPRDVTPMEAVHPLQGAVLANLSPALALEVGADPMRRGVIILSIRRGSPAARFNFRPGDLVRQINGRDIDRVRGLDRNLADVGEAWNFTLLRGTETVRVRVRRNS